MMKKSVILGGLLALSMFGLMGMGGNKEEAVKPTVGIVQTVQVYEQSKLAKLATERLEKLQSEAMARLEAMQKEMSAAEEAKDDVKKQRIQVKAAAALPPCRRRWRRNSRKCCRRCRASCRRSSERAARKRA